MGHPAAGRDVRPRPGRAAADLRPADPRRGVRHRHRRDDGRGLAAGPQDRPDRAGPGAARRRRPARVVRTPTAAARDRADRARASRSRVVGLFVGAVPHNGWWVGAGVLAVLLGVTAASPVIGRPFLRATGAADAQAVRADRAARRPELAAQPAAHDRHRLGADDRPHPGVHGGDPRRLGEGVGRQAGRGELHRRLHRQQRLRRGLLAGDHRPDGRDRRRGRRCCGSGSATASTTATADVRRGRPAPETIARLRHDHGLRRGHRPRRRHRAGREGLGRGARPHDRRHLRRSRSRPARRSGGSSASSRTPRWSSRRCSPRRRRCSTRASPTRTTTSWSSPRTARPRGLQERLDEVVEDLPVVTVKDEQAFAAEQRAPIDRIIARHLRAAGLRGRDRRPGHRQHPRPLGHRADPRDRAAARDRGQPPAAAADDPAGVGGDRGARRRARAWAWASRSASR